MMQQALVDLVWRRANFACEYCRMPQALSLLTLEIDHIIAKKHGGRTDESNLALTSAGCCFKVRHTHEVEVVAACRTHWVFFPGKALAPSETKDNGEWLRRDD